MVALKKPLDRCEVKALQQRQVELRWWPFKVARFVAFVVRPERARQTGLLRLVERTAPRVQLR